MLGAFMDGLFKGLEFHEKLYDVKQKKLMTRAAEEYLNQGKDGDTKAPLPEGKKLDGKTGGTGTTPVETQAPQTTPQTISATAADESQATPAPGDKSTSQKPKKPVTDGSPVEDDITLGRGYTGLPVPSGAALGFDASQNMGGMPVRPSTGVFRPSTVADYRPPVRRQTPWLFDKIGAGIGALSWPVQTPRFLQSGSGAPATETPPVWDQPRQPGSTLVDPNYDDPDKRFY